ncbi:hypothetical protein JCM8097_005919 [Rhodosporidiobolus ruineniae]
METPEDPARTFFPDADELPSLYDVLGVGESATDDDLKKAYRRLSLLHHPDKAAASSTSDNDRAAATLKFQQIGFAYAVLKDKARREKYDATGSTVELSAEGARTEAEWRDYFRELWTGEVSAQSIDEFKAKYQGSDEEKADLYQAYESSSGDLDTILSSIMCSTVDDEDRFVSLINSGIKSGELKATAAWKKAAKDAKGKERRRKKADEEAREAEEMAKELGVHDKLFGGKKGGAKGKGEGKGKKEDEEDDEASLRALIQGNQAKRMSNLFDSLEAKYGGGSSGKKGKKRASTGGAGDEEDEEGGSKKRAKKHEEPSEEEFAAIQARLDAQRKSGGSGAGGKKGRKSR